MTAAKIVLEPLFEAQFLPVSFGFRPNRSAHDALEAVRTQANGGAEWVLDADLADCFGQILHDALIGLVSERVSDRDVLKLIRAWLRAGVLVDGVATDTVSGTPQGSPISPLLANVALHVALLHWLSRRRIRETPSMRSRRLPRPRPAPSSAFAGYRFPPEVITLAVRWYLRFGLSYRDVEELLAERGIEVDHVSIYRWVQRFAPEFAEAARARRHVVGDRWHVDETYLKVRGTWRYLFRATDQFGQVIDVFLSSRRDANAARRFFDQAIGRTRISPVEVTTDRYRVYPRVLDEMLPAAFHRTEVHANNPLETDHGRLKARLRPMRGLKRARTARVIVAGHALVQNLRRGFYDLGTGIPSAARLADAFAELALVM